MSIELYEYLTDKFELYQEFEKEINSLEKRESYSSDEVYNELEKNKKPVIKSSLKTIDLYGATSQIRTGDPRITSAMLWPAELKWQNIKLVTPTGIEPMSPP